MDVGDVRILGKRRRNAESVRPLLEPQRFRSNVVAASRLVHQEPKPGKRESQLIDRGVAQRLRIAQLHDLGAPCVVAAESWKKYVRRALAKLVKEVVAGEQSQMRVIVHAAAGLVVRQPYRFGYRREHAIPGVSRRNDWSRFLEGVENAAAGTVAPGKTQVALSVQPGE